MQRMLTNWRNTVINWIKSLFHGKYNCKHDFTDWRVMSTKSNQYGEVRVHQARICNKCKYMQIDVQEK